MTLDLIFAFDTEEQAQADSFVGQFYRDGAWNAGCTMPGPPHQPGFGVFSIATGAPIDTKWRIFITWGPEFTDELRAHPNLVMAADRDLANAGAPREQFILYSAIPADMWSLLYCAPTPAGSNYPFGS